MNGKHPTHLIDQYLTKSQSPMSTAVKLEVNCHGFRFLSANHRGGGGVGVTVQTVNIQ